MTGQNRNVDSAPADALLRDFTIVGVGRRSDFWSVTEEIRSACPVAWSDSAWSDEQSGFWLVNQFDDVSRVTQDWARFSSADGASPYQYDLDLFRMIPLENDPPMHRQIRRVLTPFFVPEALDKVEPAIHAVVDELVDRCIAPGPVDLVSTFTAALPPRVFFEVFLGQDPKEIAWVIDTIDALFMRPEEAAQQAPRLLQWCADILAARRAEGRREDLLGVIAHAGEDDDFTLTERERVEVLHLVVLAGMETTQSALGNVAHQLSRDPSLRAEIKTFSTRQLDRAVDEFLRFESPVLMAARTTTEDGDLGGCPVRKGDRVLVSWAAANRDPQAFPDPDVLDVTRADAKRHVAFGSGIHRCLGAYLAKRELRLMIEAVRELAVFDLEPGFEPDYRGGMTRSPITLPIRCGR